MIKKRLKQFTAFMLVLCLMIPLGACHKEPETGEVSGKLLQALDDKIVVDSEGESVEILTLDSTVYDLNGAETLSVNDIVHASYHVTKGKKYADKIELKENAHEEQVFEGTVTEVTDKNITVTGKSMTVTFIRNDFSETSGDLTEGSSVKIVYTGDISEYPYASRIQVTKEKKKESKTSTVSGNVAEFTQTSLLLAIDSANSYRFKFDNSSKVTGIDKYVKVGDYVKITFSGSLNETPFASEIEIIRHAEEYTRSVNGTIDKIRDGYIVLKTDKTAYIINTDNNTKYSGDKMAEGCKAEVTYKGRLGGDCTATNIYCVKKTPDPVKYTVTFTDGNGKTLKSEKVVSGKAAEAPANPTRSGYTFKGWDKSFSKVTHDMTVNAVWKKNADTKKKDTKKAEEKKKDTKKKDTKKSEQKKDDSKKSDDQKKDDSKKSDDQKQDDSKKSDDQKQDEQQPEEKVTANGLIAVWIDADGETEENICVITLEDGTALRLLLRDDTELIPEEFVPEAGDAVTASYTESDMNLYTLELVQKYEEQPGPDDQENPDDQDTPDTPENPDDQNNPDTQDTPDDQNNPDTQEDQDIQEDQDTEDDQSEVTTEEEILIDCQGAIVEGNETDRTVKIKLADGTVIELKSDEDTKISSGYYPQKNDVVKIIYSKDDMKLKDIQLINRPEAETDIETETEED